MVWAARNRTYIPNYGVTEVGRTRARLPVLRNNMKVIHELTAYDLTLLQGLSHGYIAKELAVNTTEQMVKNRLYAIRKFMRVNTSTQAVAEALRKGIIK